MLSAISGNFKEMRPMGNEKWWSERRGAKGTPGQPQKPTCW